jgi:hypothetical protein
MLKYVVIAASPRSQHSDTRITDLLDMILKQKSHVATGIEHKRILIAIAVSAKHIRSKFTALQPISVKDPLWAKKKNTPNKLIT